MCVQDARNYGALYSQVMSTQTPAAQIAATLGPLLLRQSRVQLYDQLTRDVAGVDDATYPVLSGLARSGPATASQLAEQIGLDRTVTTRHATRLEREGLIARSPDPSDARATILRLTPQGRDAVATLRARLEAIISAALETWPPEKVADFAASFQRLVDALLHSPQHDAPSEAAR
jgi:DNA-binding MarR family transcriptional regulator